MLHAGVVPAVVPPVEFGDPEAVIVFDDGFGTCAAHGCPEQQQILYLRRCCIAGGPIFGDEVAGDQGIGKALEFFQSKSLVELSLGRRRRLPEAEAERAGPVVRGFQQIVQLAEQGLAGMLLDDTPAPIIRRGVAQRAEHTVQAGRSVSARRQFEFERVE